MMPNDVDEYATMRLNSLITPSENMMKRHDRAEEAQVEAGIEQMILVFEQLELDARRHFLAADFRQLDDARRE